MENKVMTKEETIQVLQSIEDRAIYFPNMTACDWVAISAAKRHLANSLNDMDIIASWFDHIAKISADDEIKALANDSSQFIKMHYKAQKGE